MLIEILELPSSEDKDFWKDAQIIKKEIKHEKCDHAFTYVGTNKTECVKCHIGFTLSFGWHVKDNKIYFNETLIF